MPFTYRKVLLYTAVGAGALLALAVVFGAAVDAGLFRGTLIRYLESSTGRALEVGPLEIHVLTLHPRVTAHRVTIGNPPWMPMGTLARIGRLDLSIQLPWGHRPLSFARLELQALTLTLESDDAGYANWQWTDPRGPKRSALPLLRSLSVPVARVTLTDDRRHLHFTGTISVTEPARGPGPAAILLEGSGELNGRAVHLELTGDPLTSADHAAPYRFKFAEQSSGSRLTGEGTLPRPFDVDLVDATFEAAGEDLLDLYYLAGVKLVNTARYRLEGRMSRRGAQTAFTDLVATSGQSEVRGRLSIDSGGGRPKIDIDVDSPVLRLADLGARASGREPPPAVPLLLSRAALNPVALRRDEVAATFRARRVDVGPLPASDVAGTLTLDHGVLRLKSLTGQLLGGTVYARGRADVTTDDPADTLELKITGLDLGKYLPKGRDSPLVEGVLHGRVTITGHGKSLHELASSADGTVTFAVPHGAIDTSVADMAALDLGALATLLDRHAAAARVRCAVASFDAHAGVLAAQTLVVDTEPVLITGEGGIHMEDETLDLILHGHPKRPQVFRVRSPVLVQGTLSHPRFAIRSGNVAAQTAGAIALGALLTPLASILAFVDPGLAKDTDCAALLAH